MVLLSDIESALVLDVLSDGMLVVESALLEKARI